MLIELVADKFTTSISLCYRGSRFHHSGHQHNHASLTTHDLGHRRNTHRRGDLDIAEILLNTHLVVPVTIATLNPNRRTTALPEAMCAQNVQK